MIGQKGLNLIRQWEGFKPYPYKCPADKMTIGYGHVIKENENFIQITPAEAEELLLDDVIDAEKAVIRVNEKIPLSANQYDALVSLVFNIGIGAFENSSMYGYLMSKDYVAAASEFPRWCKANKRGLKGLLKRRIDEMLLFMEE